MSSSYPVPTFSFIEILSKWNIFLNFSLCLSITFTGVGIPILVRYLVFRTLFIRVISSLLRANAFSSHSFRKSVDLFCNRDNELSFHLFGDFPGGHCPVDFSSNAIQAILFACSLFARTSASTLFSHLTTSWVMMRCHVIY